MNTRYSTDVEYGFTTLYTPNYGICHNICGTLNISFVVDRGSGVPDRHHNTGKRPEFTWIPVHSRITAFHWFMRIKTLLRKKRKAPDPGGNPGARTIAYRTQGPAPGQYRQRQGTPKFPPSPRPRRQPRRPHHRVSHPRTRTRSVPPAAGIAGIPPPPDPGGNPDRHRCRSIYISDPP